MFGSFALVVAALFTGAAFYVGFAEHPSRLELDDRAMLAEWKPSYDRGKIMQGFLAIAGFVLGVLEWLVTGGLAWLLGALALIANWPFTLLVIMPVNNELQATALEAAGPATRALMHRWGNLHWVRTLLGALATGLFLWASI